MESADLEQIIAQYTAAKARTGTPFGVIAEIEHLLGITLPTDFKT